MKECGYGEVVFLERNRGILGDRSLLLSYIETLVSATSLRYSAVFFGCLKKLSVRFNIDIQFWLCACKAFDVSYELNESQDL